MDFKKICYNCMKEKPSMGGYCPYCGFRNEDYQNAINELPPLTPLNGKYLLGRVLGSGGFGITYIAIDTHLQVVVAIKELFLKKIATREKRTTMSVIPKDKACFDDNKKRFLNEARVLAMFNEKDNEGIVSVKDYFEEKNTAYIVMEYLDGETLKARVRKGIIEYTEMLELMEPVCHALIKIHQFKVVHLDVSPDNIMILNNGQAKLLDFGGAKTIGTKDTSEQFVYKRGYAPLEQRNENGRIGEWTDVYALAATMYYCLTGEKPKDVWERESGDELKRPSEYGVRIPHAIEDALMKAMELEPTRRFHTVEDFWDALNIKTKKNNKKLLVALVVGGVVVAGIIGAIFLLGGKKTTDKTVKEQVGGDSYSELEEKTELEDSEAITETTEAEESVQVGESIPVELGTYIFENAKDRNYIMGVENGFGDDGTAVVLEAYMDANKSRFCVTDEIEGDGFYNLRAAHTNSFIETDASQAVGETLRQYEEMYDMGTEKWYFVYCGYDDEKDMNEVIIQNAVGSVLAPKDGSVEAGTEVVLTEYNPDDDAQKWYMRWSEKDKSEDDVVVYHEGELVENLSGNYNIASALDGKTCMCISRDKAFHPEPAVVVFHAEWLTVDDTLFQFNFVPTGKESRYKIFPGDQKKGQHKCLEHNPDTNELVMRKESDSENQLFRIVYVKLNTYLIQTYNEYVIGFDLNPDGSAEGVAVLARPYESVADSRLESWLLTFPQEE